MRREVGPRDWVLLPHTVLNTSTCLPADELTAGETATSKRLTTSCRAQKIPTDQPRDSWRIERNRRRAELTCSDGQRPAIPVQSHRRGRREKRKWVRNTMALVGSRAAEGSVGAIRRSHFIYNMLPIWVKANCTGEWMTYRCWTVAGSSKGTLRNIKASQGQAKHFVWTPRGGS